MANSRSIGRIFFLLAAAGSLTLDGCGCSKGGGSSSVGPVEGPSSWYTQYRKPTSSNLRAVRAPTVNSIIVAGEATAIYRSDDGGLSWGQIEHRPVSRGGDIVSLDFFNANVEAVGPDSKFPADGRVWTAVNGVLDFITPDLDATGAVPAYTSVDVTSDTTSYRLRTDGVVEKNVGGVVTTPFPGLGAGTWTSIDFFGTTDTGFAVGDGYKIRKTTAGGAWANGTVTSFPAPGLTTHPLRKVSFVTQLIGFACGDNTSILRTNDGGVNWTQQLPNPSDFVDVRAFHSIHFPVDDQHGWAVGDQGLIAGTLNGGTSWNILVSLTTEDLYDVWFVDNSTGYVAGNHGIILRTIDGGNSWTRVPLMTTPDSLTRLNAVDFASDGRTGLAVGDGGLILLTFDGGATWTPQSNADTNNLFGVALPKNGSGAIAYACGANGVIVKTSTLTSAVPTWTPQSVLGGAPQPTFRAILFPSDDVTGYVCGDGSNLRHTTDGLNWNVPAPSNPPTSATNWLALSADAGGLDVYVGGSNGISAKTTNSGVNWSNLAVVTGAPTINAFQSPTSAVLYAGTSDGKVWTGDGVAAWTATTPPAGTSVASMSFADSLSGWIASDPAPFTGGVFTTVNGGATWTRSYVHTKWPLHAIWTSPLNPLLVYVVGDNGTILKTTTGGQ